MKIAVKVEYNHLPRIAARLQTAAGRIVQETCAEIEADVKAQMAEAKHGQEYVRGARVHVASAPGEAPAMDTGALAEVQTSMVKPTRGIVHEDEEYAVYMEYGTGATGAAWPLPERPSDVKYTLSVVGMAPRPHMTPAGERARPRFVKKMREIEGRL